MTVPEGRPDNIPPAVVAKMRKADKMGALLVSLPKWIAGAVIAWQIRLSIEVLAGKYALPSLLIRFWRQASPWEVLCWIAGALGVIFGLYSRYLLHRQVFQHLSQLRAIEKHLDYLSTVSGTSLITKDRSRP